MKVYIIKYIINNLYYYAIRIIYVTVLNIS